MKTKSKFSGEDYGGPSKDLRHSDVGTIMQLTFADFVIQAQALEAVPFFYVLVDAVDDLPELQVAELVTGENSETTERFEALYVADRIQAREQEISCLRRRISRRLIHTT